MATAVTEKKQEVTQVESPIHHMVRALGPETKKTEAGDQIYSVDAVDAQVASWLEQGYSLKDTHFLGAITTTGLNGTSVAGYRILYIFVKNGSV